MLDNIGLVHTTNDMWSVEYLLEVVKSITFNLLCLVVESLFKSLRIFIPISMIAQCIQNISPRFSCVVS